MGTVREKLIVALDVPTLEEAKSLVMQLKDCLTYFKVGMQLYNSEGTRVLKMIHDLGGRVFLDLKFHDIPNTVAGASEVVTGHGVWMFNLHTAGGLAMMQEAVKASQRVALAKHLPLPLIIGVTVLTSIDQSTLEQEMGIKQPIKDYVLRLARLAKQAGLHGVVASAHEIEAIRKVCGKGFLIITPGVRPSWSAPQDQKRVMTPGEAIQAGADFLVVGRPITEAPNPVEAAKRILQEMEEAAKDGQ